jgi:hypothetical protein
VGASPAQAQTCVTRGHAYVTQPGRIYFSGYEGDQSVGIPTWNTFRGDTFRIGGNGIQPGTPIRFQAVNIITRAQIDFLPGVRVVETRKAGTNCVVNESGLMSVTAPSGQYRITAIYTSGNAGGPLVDQVVDVVVR